MAIIRTKDSVKEKVNDDWRGRVTRSNRNDAGLPCWRHTAPPGGQGRQTGM